MRVAFQGARGAFIELAVRHWWRDAEPLPCATFAAVLAAVADGLADAGVIPVANRIVGPVEAALAALAGAGATVRITGQVTIPVNHALMACEGTTLADVRIVRSHPVALAQCTRTIARLGAQGLEAYDTAGAARELAAHPTPGVAVIAPAGAAERYGLVLLAEAIQDDPDNWTRFARVERV